VKLASKLTLKVMQLMGKMEIGRKKQFQWGRPSISSSSHVLLFCFGAFIHLCPKKKKLNLLLFGAIQKNEKKIVLFLCFGVFIHLCPIERNCTFWDPSKNKFSKIKQLFFSNVLEN
jgi:hypothetical protein